MCCFEGGGRGPRAGRWYDAELGQARVARHVGKVCEGVVGGELGCLVEELLLV